MYKCAEDYFLRFKISLKGRTYERYINLCVSLHTCMYTPYKRNARNAPRRKRSRYKYLFLDEQQFSEMENRTFWRFLGGTPISGNFDKCLRGVPSSFGRILIWLIVRLLYNEFQWWFYNHSLEKAAIFYLVISLLHIYGTRATRHNTFKAITRVRINYV